MIEFCYKNDGLESRKPAFKLYKDNGTLSFLYFLPISQISNSNSIVHSQFLMRQKFKAPSNLKYNNNMFYLLEEGHIYQLSTQITINKYSSFDLWDIPSHIEDIVHFEFIDKFHIAILYNKGRNICNMHIINKTSKEMWLPTEFVGDFIFILDEVIYSYNVNNSKLYQCFERIESKYTGINITDVIKNGHTKHNIIDGDEFYYFFNGKLKKLRKKV